MSTVTVTEAVRRAGRLIPVRSSSVRGDYAAVCTSPSELPRAFRAAQAERHETYMTTGARNLPASAPRYVVTYRGMPVAWVNLDGTTHFATELSASDSDIPSSARVFQRAWQVQAELQRTWPERFDMDSMGDPR
jgi:hypothetical protein